MGCTFLSFFETEAEQSGANPLQADALSFDHFLEGVFHHGTRLGRGLMEKPVQRLVFGATAFALSGILLESGETGYETAEMLRALAFNGRGHLRCPSELLVGETPGRNPVIVSVEQFRWCCGAV